MKTVHKHPIVLANENHKFSLLLPAGFKFLRAMLQNGSPFMWLEINADSPKSEVQFGVWGTGQEIPDSAKYQGTFDFGPLIFHLYLLS